MKESTKQKIDEFWNRHDGTLFYKEELIELIEEILKEVEEENYYNQIEE